MLVFVYGSGILFRYHYPSIFENQIPDNNKISFIFEHVEFYQTKPTMLE